MPGEDFFNTPIESGDQALYDALFPSKRTPTRFQHLQMTTELSSRLTLVLAVNGVVRRCSPMGKKEDILRSPLEILQEEIMLNKISQDRKGRLELTTIESSKRQMLPGPRGDLLP